MMVTGSGAGSAGARCWRYRSWLSARRVARRSGGRASWVGSSRAGGPERATPGVPGEEGRVPAAAGGGRGGLGGEQEGQVGDVAGQAEGEQRVGGAGGRAEDLQQGDGLRGDLRRRRPQLRHRRPPCGGREAGGGGQRGRVGVGRDVPAGYAERGGQRRGEVGQASVPGRGVPGGEV